MRVLFFFLLRTNLTGRFGVGGRNAVCLLFVANRARSRSFCRGAPGKPTASVTPARRSRSLSLCLTRAIILGSWGKEEKDTPVYFRSRVGPSRRESYFQRCLQVCLWICISLARASGLRWRGIRREADLASTQL